MKKSLRKREAMRKLNKKNLVYLLIGVFVFALLINLPNLTSRYILRVLNQTLITYINVLSLYVVFGMAGQTSFAQCGLYGIGAYITANVATRAGLPPLVAVVASMAGTALFAFIIGGALFRLKRFYFTFATIGLMMILNGIFANWTAGTGGPAGMENLVQFSIGSYVFDTEKHYFFLILFCALLVTLVSWLIYRSVLGRSFMAIRDDELAANCMGINSLLTKDIAFAISGAMCGLAGSLFAFLAGYISATSFDLSQSQLYLVMIMLGGSSSPLGAAIGSLLLSLMPEWFRFLKDYMLLVYGVGIMVLMVVLPEGLVGGIKDLYEKRSHRKQSYSDAS